jgi:hypothetical protein
MKTLLLQTNKMRNCQRYVPKNSAETITLHDPQLKCPNSPMTATSASKLAVSLRDRNFQGLIAGLSTLFVKRGKIFDQNENKSNQL